MDTKIKTSSGMNMMRLVGLLLSIIMMVTGFIFRTNSDPYVSMGAIVLYVFGLVLFVLSLVLIIFVDLIGYGG